jgi:hypothetical protein
MVEVHGCRWECVPGELLHLITDSYQKARKGLGTKYTKAHSPSDLLLALRRPHLLKFPESPKITPLIGVISLWGSWFLSQTLIPVSYSASCPPRGEQPPPPL